MTLGRSQEKDAAPAPYLSFKQAYPEIEKLSQTLAERCYQAGPLDARAARLTKLGIAIGAGSKGAVKSHARRALEAGASPAELRHAAVLALTTLGLPAMMAALAWVDEVLADG
jgi:4-carboxymuconolactone decarboxylase